MKLKYEVPSIFGITPCPFNMGYKVGTIGCANCPHFRRKNSEKSYVVCKHPKRRKYKHERNN